MLQVSNNNNWWRKWTPLNPLLVLTVAASLSILHTLSSLPTVNGAVIPQPQHHASDKGQSRFFVPSPSRHPSLPLPLLEEESLQDKRRHSKSNKEQSDMARNWIRRHLATKSPYPHADRPHKQLNDVPEGYELAQVQMLCRHGTRFPSKSVSAAMADLSQRLQETRIPGFEWIRQWSAPEYYPLEKGNLLASKGDADMYMIGRRLATRYNQFLDKYPYDGIRYDIRSSDATRCTQSAHGFTMGLLEGRHTKDPRGALANQDATTGVVDAAEIDHGQIHGQSAEKKNGRHSRVDFPPIQPASIYTIPKGLDQELAVKYSCPRWLSAVADHPLVSQHEDMYIKNHVQPIADRLTQLFFPKTSNNTHDGVHKDGDDGGSDQRTIITTKDVQLIYQMCGYEMSFYDDHETWCQLLWKPHHPRSHPHRSSAAQAAWSEIGDNDDNSDSEEDENEETEEPEWERTMTDPVEPESKHSHHHGSETSTLDDLGLDFLHLEYLSDLGDYYGYGPGVPFNQHLARPLARGLIDSVDKILNTTTASETLGQTMSPYSWTVSDLTSRRRTWTHPPMGMGHHVSEKMFLDPEDDDGSNGFAHRAVLKFGHSETVMFWSTFLGLYDDGAKQPPRGDQSGLKESDRAFRASVFSPFAANMILEVYRPLQEKPLGDNREVDDKSLKKPRKYRGALVRLLVNEVPHAIPGCGNTSSNSNNDGESHSAMDGHDASLFCEWSILRAKLIARGADQGFEQCCEIENGALAGAHGCSSYNFSQGDGKTASGQCLSTEPFPLVG